METKRRFLRLAAIGNQATHQIDEEIHWTAMTRVLDLRDIFQLVNNCLDNRALSQQNLIEDRHEFVFHIRFDPNDELNVEICQEFFKKWLRNIASITNQFAKHAAHQFRNWFSVIDISRREHHIQDFATIIDDQMQFEAEKPTGRCLPALCQTCKNAMLGNAPVVTNVQGGRIDE